MGRSFIPDEFVVPTIYKTENFTIRKLTVLDLQKDYIAVMEARDHIHELYTKEYTNGWPADNLTLEEDENDLKRHEKEFNERVAFAYTVFDIQNENCLGCIYIDPSDCYDAEITMWTRDHVTDMLLYKTVKKWIENHWPFKNTYYPILGELYDK
ncbi:hypothetical protein [Clostridium cibarium]|uniref:N-acetyltransferase domain-containing protein n=1 Tax=Clostridium cibarium TaxID=2762247 RepID=A0ABR8PXI1_9CLOT|nr:hypothetical protein [Clostridium cibarium]MBD7912858.1 hypothetical protein [Clostridium cibarium]